MSIIRNILGVMLIGVYAIVGITVFLIGIPIILFTLAIPTVLAIAPFLFLNHLYDGWELFWWTLGVTPIWILALCGMMADDYYN